MKRKMALLLVLGMLVFCFTGCGNSNDTSNSSPSNAAKATGTEEKPYEATVMYWASNDPRDVQHVEDSLNELSIPDINVKIHLQPVTLGTYMQQIQMVLSSDDALDIFPIFGSNAGSYIDAGYVVNIAPFLDSAGSDLTDIIGKEDIKCCSIGDFLWGVPTMHERSNPIGYVVRTDLLKEAGFTADDVKTMADMTKVYAKVKELHPDMILYSGINNLTQPLLQSTFDPLGGGNFGVLLNYGQNTTVSNWYESDEFVSWVQLMYDWNQRGYVSKDLAVSADSGESLIKAGNLFSFTSYVKPNSKQEKDAATGYDTTILQVTEPACYTATTNAGAYGIPANAKDPEKAVKLLNWLYKTKEANDLLNWGVKGVDYEVKGDGTIGFPEGVSTENVEYHQDYGWAMFNQYNSYVWEGNDVDIWDKYKEVRDKAIVSKAYGFTFNTEPVLNELAALTAVTDEYLSTIAAGDVDSKTGLKELNSALYAAGLQKVMDEKQSQLDAWLAKK
ncbi:ABC transporter substrate-binding protein [Anaerocolumna xylanovorans]|uniref:Putative aldouronate transport system substrate-binding protein n=1 Tax=Anaerocolumna xylanovorans DSM 12503 TaxID=1121345 RepID=A0A1M7Y0Z7_9FIRM|nr:ABC transporter substrate-binding protein [Anaerocolumna xylanovorans]SHO45362.1 putative aldouronate transport system substrate-binding protein [Anaerocolumna xylanovorans DSM 12503]